MAEYDAAAQGLARLTLTMCLSGSVSSVAGPHMAAWLSSAGVGRLHVALTPSAQQFVTTNSLRPFVNGSVLTDESSWSAGGAPAGGASAGGAPHVRIAAESDAVVVAPATAATLGKLANGICDNIVTQIVMAAECPVILAPVMNPAMLAKPAVRRNLDVLRADGFVVAEPGQGVNATNGRWEAGSMADFRSVFAVALKSAAERKSASD
ncbi:flavoprotein [Streptomyces sp. L2]|uniref:flavoprotein n=1 Tax=Streptomyces sp. L2 TaxID=2162665 RepID=UPI00101134B9|nr:flavoprotein [Streptomyces sp. L2]